MEKKQEIPTELYIIGNGFDQHHGLPTTYCEFCKHVKEFGSSQFLSEIECYFGGEALWENFEDSLGLFDWKKFFDSHNNIDIVSEDFRPSSIYCLEDDLSEQAGQLIDDMKSNFDSWINSIDVSTVKKKLALSKNAYFITFNYTSVLESAYDISKSKILHIHGKADEHEDLIFGHGEFIEEVTELDKNGDSNRTIFSDAEAQAKYPLHAFRKPVSEIIKSNECFFQKLSCINCVNIIGHSLNEVDLPYFKEIHNKVGCAKWRVSYHEDKEKELFENKLIKSVGVDPNLLQVGKIDELNIGLY